MRLPLINLPTVYHVGDLDPGKRGEQYPHSLEGAWLSASLCPEAWTKIARLGGKPIWSLCKPDALYLDVHNMGIDHDFAMNWAESKGFICRKSVFRVSHFDTETEDWRSSVCASKEEAEAELEDLKSQDLNGALCEESMWVLTEMGRERAKQGPALREANDFALQFWVEDVLRKKMPQIVGLYWNEEFDPDKYSAPRAAIVPEAVESMEKAKVDLRYLDEDEDLLDARPLARLYRIEDLESPYCFVTDCVSANGDDINKMMDDPACKDITYVELLTKLGDGGQELLDSVFPEYKDTVDMGLTLETDRCVTYHESSYRGVPCVFVRHSAIEYVFQREGMINAPEFQFRNWFKLNESVSSA